MRNLFHRRDKRQSLGSDDGVEIKERRSSIFRRHLRCSEDSEIVELMRPRDTVVTRISESSESPKERRGRRRRSLLEGPRRTSDTHERKRCFLRIHQVMNVSSWRAACYKRMS
ncbi:hypothetical protein GQ600_14641 [Phytophthora cactorum]|nr:hypothetical protein GQ600_14641 [Phytophthora cactorum]